MVMVIYKREAIGIFSILTYLKEWKAMSPLRLEICYQEVFFVNPETGFLKHPF